MVKTKVVWFPDSGATNHLTNATHAPHLTTFYIGPGKVLVNNEFSLYISAIGSIIVPTTRK